MKSIESNVTSISSVRSLHPNTLIFIYKYSHSFLIHLLCEGLWGEWFSLSTLVLLIHDRLIEYF